MLKEVEDYWAKVNASAAPEAMKAKANIILDKINASNFRDECGTDNGLNGVAEIVGRIVEAALTGKDHVTVIGARHDGATRILKAITA